MSARTEVRLAMACLVVMVLLLAGCGGGGDAQPNLDTQPVNCALTPVECK